MKPFFLISLLFLSSSLPSQLSTIRLNFNRSPILQAQVINHQRQPNLPLARENKLVIPNQTQDSTKPKGYFNHTSGNLYMVNLYNTGYNSLGGGFHTINGVYIKNKATVGLGFGIDFIYYWAFMPIYGDFRYYINREGIDPFVEAYVGRSLYIYPDKNR